jgi:hypothetical protein
MSYGAWQQVHQPDSPPCWGWSRTRSIRALHRKTRPISSQTAGCRVDHAQDTLMQTADALLPPRCTRDDDNRRDRTPVCQLRVLWTCCGTVSRGCHGHPPHATRMVVVVGGRQTRVTSRPSCLRRVLARRGRRAAAQAGRQACERPSDGRGSTARRGAGLPRCPPLQLPRRRRR